MYVSEQQQNHQTELPTLDPALLNAAQQIYQTYCAIHSKSDKQPLGVAIDPKTGRGQVICKKLKPILLYGERFLKSDVLESEN